MLSNTGFALIASIAPDISLGFTVAISGFINVGNLVATVSQAKIFFAALNKVHRLVTLRYYSKCTHNKNLINYRANYSLVSAAKLLSFFCFSPYTFILINIPKYTFKYTKIFF